MCYQCFFLYLIFILLVSSFAILILLFPSLLHALETDYFLLYLFSFIIFDMFSLCIYFILFYLSIQYIQSTINVFSFSFFLFFFFSFFLFFFFSFKM